MEFENKAQSAADEHTVVNGIIKCYEQLSGLKCYYLQASEALNGLVLLDGCEYCRNIQSTHDGLYKCSRQRNLALKEAVANGGGEKIFRCHAGFVEWVVPVTADEGVKGFFCSGFVGEQHALDNLSRQKDYFSQRYGIEANALLKIIQTARVMDKASLDTLAQILRLMVRYHFPHWNEKSLQSGRRLQLLFPEEYYDHLGTSDQLKAIENTTYRELFSRVRQQSGSYGVRKLREEINEMQELFCQHIADNRTVEAKDVMIKIMSPAYADPDPEWRIYETYKRIGRITKRLHDYFGYSEELDHGKFEIFRHLLNAQTQKEVRLVTNDFFLLIVQCFGYHGKDRPLDVYEQAKAYVAQCCGRNVKVSDVARALGITPDYLNRVFKAKQGTTIKKYILLARVAKVKELLERTDWSIETIAEVLNYNNVRSLHRVFNSINGMTCGEYRLLYRRKDALPPPESPDY